MAFPVAKAAPSHTLYSVQVVEACEQWCTWENSPFKINKRMHMLDNAFAAVDNRP